MNPTPIFSNFLSHKQENGILNKAVMSEELPLTSPLTSAPLTSANNAFEIVIKRRRSFAGKVRRRFWLKEYWNISISKMHYLGLSSLSIFQDLTPRALKKVCILNN
jgi:hypothetical protein